MKFTAGILSLLIICVFAIPSNTFEKISSKNTIENTAKSCCEAHNDNSENQDSDCCNNNCNPFVKCCSMMGFIIESPISFTNFSTLTSIENCDFYQSPISFYKGEIWQPPQL